MFGDTTISQVKVWNHLIETTTLKGMFRVPGTHYTSVHPYILISEAESFFVHFPGANEKVIMQRLVGDVANGYPPVVSMLDAGTRCLHLGFFRRQLYI